MRLSKNTILITGGSSGIGLALAKEFLKEENRVIICGRNKANLEKVKKELGVEAIVVDLSDPKQVEALAKEAERQHVNILINNAGVMHSSASNEELYTTGIEEIKVNYLAPLQLCTLLLPALKREDNGAIINIGSVLAEIPSSQLVTYCASKSALHTFTKGFRKRAGNVKVIEVLLPLVDTRMFRKLSGNKISAEEVARAILKGMRKDSKEVNPGMAKRNRLMNRIVSRTN